jgi:hypothetical protein
MHLFVHALDTIPKNYYIELEVCKGTKKWEYLTRNFKVNFNFKDDSPSVDRTLQIKKKKRSLHQKNRQEQYPYVV